MKRQSNISLSFPMEVDDAALRGMFFDRVVMQVTTLEFDGEKDGKPTYKATFSEVDASALKLTA
jgi:hypothetical protein